MGALTVDDVIHLPVLASARPKVVSGAADLGRSVRWMHSSEIFDIAPLMHGGEVLMTSGLGLVGSSAAQMTSYVASLSDAGVSALFFEVGRTFPTLPDPVLLEARRRDLVLVVLRGVTPFVDVTEAVHRRLVLEETSILREREALATRFMKVLVDGGGPEEVLNDLYDITGLGSSLTSTSGRLLARTPQQDVQRLALRKVRIEVLGDEWGVLEVHGELRAEDDLAVEVAAMSLSLALARAGGSTVGASQRDKDLVEDITTGSYRTVGDLAARCAVAGLRQGPGEALVTIAFGVRQGTPSRRAVAAAAEAGRRILGGVLAAQIQDDTILIGSTKVPDEHSLRALVDRFVEILDSELSSSNESRVLAVTAAAPTYELADLNHCVIEAREASALARRLGVRTRGLLATDIGVHRLLSRLVDDPQLERFVLEQIGPVLEYDARHGSELLMTLDAYFASGLSKTRAAEMLGVRRQTLYSRLERLSGLLGGVDFDRHERRSAIEIALVAWRLRTSSMFPTREPPSGGAATRSAELS